ncbi:MAG: AAA family ATPase [Magnetococcales bacterium]|nr:AAA family ATPase [Magnetococcales bacterium]
MASHPLPHHQPDPVPVAGQHSAADVAAMAAQREAYLDYLGLHHNPFPVVPDIDHFFLPARIDALIAEILHSIYTRKGFMVITGEVGLGKTTVSRRILQIMDDQKVETALVFNTFVQGTELLEEINRDFGIVSEGKSLQNLLAVLNTFLLERFASGKNCAVIIDDAQNLTLDSLEMLRLISNLETNSDKLVQLILVGQPELMAKLNAHELRQLRSRIVVLAEVAPYTVEEMKQYIYFKLNAAGSRGTLTIPERSFRLMHLLTGGNPRRINILLDRCLYGLFAYNTMQLSQRLVTEVAGELGMHRPKPAWRKKVASLGWPVFGTVGLAGAAVAAGMVLMMRPPAPVDPLHDQKVQEERQKAENAKAEAAFELAKAKAAREQAAAELTKAQGAKEQALSELAKVQATQEKAKAEVAAARAAESLAMQEAAKVKESSSSEGKALAEALGKARASREQAEAKAGETEARIEELNKQIQSQEQTLAEVQQARQKAESETSEAQVQLERLKSEAKHQAEALAQAKAAQEQSRAEAEKAKAEALTAQEEAKRQGEALTQAKAAQEQTLAELLKVRQEQEQARAEVSKARMAEAKALTDAAQTVNSTTDNAQLTQHLAATRTAREQAEAKASQVEASLSRLQGEAQNKEKTLTELTAARQESEAKAERAESQLRELQAKAQNQAKALEEAVTAQKKAQQEAEQAQQEAAKAQAEARDVLAKAKAEREKAEAEIVQARKETEKAISQMRAAKEEVQTLAVQVESGQTVKPPEEVRQFLAAYGLENQAEGFTRALREGWLGEMGERIAAVSGQRLVTLDRPPPGTQDKYTLFQHTDAAGKSRALLFWKPAYAVDSFYYGYTGPEIHKLQDRLAALGLYPYPVDGVVGKNTMKALSRFQQIQHLPVTGTTDSATLFSLEHAAPPKERHWVIQGGAYRDRPAAEEIVQKMKGLGIRSFVQPITAKDGKKWETVRIGPFADRDEASIMLQELRPHLDRDAKIIEWTGAQTAPKVPSAAGR